MTTALQSSSSAPGASPPRQARAGRLASGGRRRTLYILVEVGARDLLSRLVLAEEARRRGYRVVLGEKNLVRNLCFLFHAPPGIILDKCGQMCRSYPIVALKRRGFRYVVLDEEGIFFSHSRRAPEPTDLMLFNSEYQRRLTNRRAPPDDVVGNPRLYPKSLLPYLDDEVRAIRERYGEFVLICSSFDPKMKSSYGFAAEAELDARYRELFYQVIERLAGRVPIVYRPHPSDGEEFAARVARLVPVERRFNILPWITASRLLVNAKCTSTFEAVRLGVPSATLCLKSGTHSKLDGLSRRFYNVDALCRYVEGGVYSLELPRYKRDYIALISGPEDPHRRLLNRLDALEVPETARFRGMQWAARATRFINGVSWGRRTTAYIRAKYGSLSYAERFSGFASHLGGHLLLSRE